METKIPTLEEVKEYFKNAKKVKCVFDNKKYDISEIKGQIELNLNSYRCYDKYNEEVLLWSFKQKKYAEIISYKEEMSENIGQLETPKHYDNSKGSIYQFCENQNLNSYEFEVIKRIVRCRKKGEFLSDIKKTIQVLEIYLQEQGEKFKGENEILNK